MKAINLIARTTWLPLILLLFLFVVRFFMTGKNLYYRCRQDTHSS